MADITNTASGVRVVVGAIVRRFTLTGAVTVGDVVYIDSTGGAQKASASGLVALSEVRGMVVSVQPASGTLGQTTGVSGDKVDVVMFGPVEFAPAANLTPGLPLYVSAVTAGRMDQTKPATVGWFPTIVGFAESTSRVFINPPAIITVAN
jgi:hypothetical protein